MPYPPSRNAAVFPAWPFRVLVPILVGLLLASLWIGVSVVAARSAEFAPFPSLGTIFRAASEALSAPQRKPVAAKHRHPAPRVAKAVPARPRPSQPAMAYAAEPDRKTEVYSIVARERAMPAAGGVIAAIIKVES